MSESWYVRSSDGDRGLFEFTQPLRLIRSDRLSGADEVNSSPQGQWIKVKKPCQPKSSESSSRPQPSRLVLIWEAIDDRANPPFAWQIVTDWLGAILFSEPPERSRLAVNERRLRTCVKRRPGIQGGLTT